jgi:hypothetical protein
MKTIFSLFKFDPPKTLINTAFITIIFSVSNVLPNLNNGGVPKEDRLYVSDLFYKQMQLIERLYQYLYLLNEEIKELKKEKTVTNKN